MSSPEARSPSPLTPAEQARIRRERRQAKVRESAGSRLDRITSTQGSTFRSEAPGVSSTPFEISPSPPIHSDDPPVIDISRHTPVPNKAEELQQAALIEQMFSGGPPQSSEAGLAGMASIDNDPMMKLLAQMSGGGGGGAPGLGGMLGTMGGDAQQDASSTSAQQDWIWRLVHGLASMALALFVVFGTNFDGSEEARIKSSEREQKPLFWYFATMELVLQSTRFLLEKGRPPQGSILASIGAFLPPPFGGYVTTLARYSAFVNVIMTDAGVVIFFLGLAAWWNSS